MRIVHSRTFKSGNSEAVHLPDEMAFGEGVEVEISRSGDTVTIRPKARCLTGKELVEALQKLPQPKQARRREKIEFPKRPGL